MSTVFSQIDDIINSRPLCALSNDRSEVTCLNSGQFLVGKNLTAYPNKDVTEVPEFWLNGKDVLNIYNSSGKDDLKNVQIGLNIVRNG